MSRYQMRERLISALYYAWVDLLDNPRDIGRISGLLCALPIDQIDAHREALLEAAPTGDIHEGPALTAALEAAADAQLAAVEALPWLQAAA